MSTERILIDACETVVMMDGAGAEIPGGSILVEGGVIRRIGTGIPHEAGTVHVDGRGTVALPGFINTHHHLYQTLTRVRAQDQRLFGWLQALYPVWAGLDEDWERAASRAALAELALSGCSTTSDHHYLFPAGVPSLALLAAEVEAAREIGLRFHPCRGSMDRGESRGGLPPDSVVQDTEAILAETEDAVRRFHDPSPGSLLRLAIAPCSPFSVTDGLMRESAALARRLGVRLHTHIAETPDEDAYCQTTYGCRPVELLESLDWLGPDVWLAHCVWLGDDDIRRMARSGAAVAWCPASNLRLGSGIAPVPALRDAGVPVGLAVDGSASNDAGNMLAEARLGMLVARARPGRWMSAREVLWIATRGGAACLGRDDIGSLEVGKRADIALIPVDGVEAAGADTDLVAAVVSCAPPRVRDLFVEGRAVVRHGRLVGADEQEIAATARRLGRRLPERSSRRTGR
jgi:cytosine/adenosine deaminase-related metal-dependent hydrolase